MIEALFCPTCKKQGATYNCQYFDYMIYCTCENHECPDKVFSDSFNTDEEAIKDWNQKIGLKP